MKRLPGAGTCPGTRSKAPAKSCPAVRRSPSGGETKAIAGYHPDGLVLRQGGHLHTVRFGQSGLGRRRPGHPRACFPGNDTPGLLGPRALYRLLIRDGLDLAGRHVLIVGSGLDFWLSAAFSTPAAPDSRLVLTDSGKPSEVVRRRGPELAAEHGLEAGPASRPQGENSLRAAFSPRVSGNGPAGSHLVIDADLAVICGRGKPAYDIPYQLGAD